MIQDMMDILDNQLGYTNKILLLLDGNMPRFTSGLTDMLRQMNAIFGENWWDFMMIGVSKVSQSVIIRLVRLRSDLSFSVVLRSILN